jgi:hypothetical protein
MDKIYILVFGTKRSGFYSLGRLAKSIGISKAGLKEKLPFKQGSFEIFEVEVDTRI